MRQIDARFFATSVCAFGCAFGGFGCGVSVAPAVTAADAGNAPDTGLDATATRADAPAGSDGVIAADAGSPDVTAVLDIAPGPPPLTYEGTCPEWKTGVATVTSGGFTRNMRVYLPPEPKGAPVMFLWHGLGDTAANLAAGFNATKIAQDNGMVVVAPDSCCNSGAGAKGCCLIANYWGFAVKPEADRALFRDTLHCLDKGLAIDRKRVYTMGFSAGALWSTWLVMNEAPQLAAAVLWSGGVADFMEWTAPAANVPVLVAWGGKTDEFGNGIVNFAETSKAFIQKLRQGGHAVVACDHGGGHTVPPGGPKWGVEFLLAHTWGGAPSALATALPKSFPAYCQVAP
ncbi:MAG: hypothetical protein EXR79_15230 [Myxococcales bacterium]|nr:hypothetical protein [Myxococcales bacterium]